MATVSEIANDLASLCTQGKFLDVIEKHYAKNIVSIEPMGGPDMPARQEGLDAVKAKNKWWVDNHEVHNGRVDGPFIGKDQFAVRFYFDVTAKNTGKRMEMTEMALYTVKDGKIAKEEFYYNMPSAPPS